MIRASFIGLGALGAAAPACPVNSGKYDSNGFAIHNRCGNVKGRTGDVRGSPTAQPYWNVFGTIRFGCAEENGGQIDSVRRLEQVMGELQDAGYEIGTFNVGERVGRRGQPGVEPNFPYLCGSTATNEIVLRVFHRTKTPEQAKSDVFNALARLGFDSGNVNVNWAIETFAQMVFDPANRAAGAAADALVEAGNVTLDCLGDQDGKKTTAIFTNVAFISLGLLATYLMVGVVRPLMPRSS